MAQDGQSADEHLTTGWEPETPVTDTLMRQVIFTLAGEVSSVVESLGGRVGHRPGWIATDTGRPAAFYNGCILTQPLTVEGVAPLLRFLHDFFDFGGSSTGMVVLFSLWPTPDLREYGWQLMGHPPAHLRPAGGVAPPDPAGVEIVQVTTAEALHEWERGAIEGYFDDLLEMPAGALTSPALLDDPRHRMWIARLNGKVAGVSSAFVDNGIAYVSLVATVPEARGRGIGTSLTWRATLAEPDLPATLLSSDEGRPLYDRMGYLAITRMTLWYRIRPGSGS